MSEHANEWQEIRAALAKIEAKPKPWDAETMEMFVALAERLEVFEEAHGMSIGVCKNCGSRLFEKDTYTEDGEHFYCCG